MATFLLDVYCVGVKDVTLRVDEASEIERFMEALGQVQPMAAIEPTRARKLLRELVAWSRSIGLALHPDYATAEPLFGDVSADSSDESFRFGKDGKPFLSHGPSDTPARIRKRIEALRRAVGDGGFDYMLEVEGDDDRFVVGLVVRTAGLQRIGDVRRQHAAHGMNRVVAIEALVHQPLDRAARG